MITINNITLSRNGQNLIEKANAAIYAGDCIGLVGENGCGKSTLLAAIKGNYDIDSGNIEIANHLKIASVKQETPSLEIPAIEYVLDGHKLYRELSEKLVYAQNNNNPIEIAEIHEQLAQIEAYSLPAKALELLCGLGFRVDQQQKLVSEFSGGWRMRLNLAQALISPCDLLLLDEPTNHLDLETVIWLQDFLLQHKAAKIIIAHDKEFLDSLCKQIFSIENKKLSVWKGNYTQYEILRNQKIEHTNANFAKEESRRKHLQAYIDRFRYKASKSRQAQSRLKALEKLSARPEIYRERHFPISINTENPPDQLLQLINISSGYSKAYIENFSLNINAGLKLGLLGVNGSGKSTLIKTIAGIEAPYIFAGKRNVHANTKIAYFAQHQIDNLDPQKTPLSLLNEVKPDWNTQEQRNFLGSYGFSGDKVQMYTKNFSGGEKARLSLSLLVATKPNLLLLDEPTNHLDLAMREDLANALQNFAGSIILVSHDRSLLRMCCDEFLLVNNGKITPYSGDLDDYREFIKELNKNKSNDLKENNQKFNSKLQKRKNTAQKNELLRPIKKEIQQIELEMNKINEKLSHLENTLLDQDLYQEQNKDKLLETLSSQSKLKNHLEELENIWLDLNTRLEELETSIDL